MSSLFQYKFISVYKAIGARYLHLVLETSYRAPSFPFKNFSPLTSFEELLLLRARRAGMLMVNNRLS